MRLVLLPGLDGTGELFADFVAALPSWIESTVVSFPSDEFLSYSELQSVVAAIFPQTESFFLLAESFSTPLAITVVAHAPRNLLGAILVAGFSRDPARSRLLAKLASHPAFFKIPTPSAMLRFFLAGWDADRAFIRNIQRVIRQVRPEVLSGRVREVLNCDVRADLPRIKVPLLCIRAENENLLRRECGNEILSGNRNATLENVSSPHMILQRAPERSVELVAGFIRQHRPQTAVE